MRFSTLAGDLAAAASVAAQLVASRNVNETLGMLLLAAEGHELSITAHNLDESIVVKADAEVREPGAVLVDAQRFSQLVAGMPDSTSIGAETDGHILKLNAGRGRYRLATRLPEDFPAALAPTGGKDSVVEIPLNDNAIRCMFRIPLTTASSEEVRYLLNGVNLQRDGDSIVATGTDGYRLICTETAGAFSDAAAVLQGGVILPRSACHRIAKMGGDVLRTDGQTFAVVNAKRRITYASKHIDGTFPNCRPLVVRESETEATVDRKDLAASLARIETFRAADMEGRGKGVKMPLVVSWKETGAITLFLPDTDLRGAIETLDAATAGEARFGCDAGYLLSVVNSVGCETIAIEAPREPGRRIRITAVDDPGFVAIVMPMWLAQTVDEHGEAA